VKQAVLLAPYYLLISCFSDYKCIFILYFYRVLRFQPTSNRLLTQFMDPKYTYSSLPNISPLLAIHVYGWINNIYCEILVTDQLNAQIIFFITSLFYASTCFEHYVLIINRSKLYYTASGIITHCRWPRTECDDNRSCIIQFRTADDEHIVLETCRGIK